MASVNKRFCTWNESYFIARKERKGMVSTHFQYNLQNAKNRYIAEQASKQANKQESEASSQFNRI